MADTPLNDDGAWYDSIAPEGEENIAARESLANFDNAGAYLEHVNTLENKNWRDDFAGDDDKFKSTLERFSTPADFAAAYREGQATISSGQLAKPLAEDAGEDDVKAYREANGIPLESHGYLENLPEGLVVGENDAPIAEIFMEALHTTNAPPAVAHALLAKYNEFAQESQDAQADLDSEQSAEATAELRTTWGADYKANINMVGAFMASTFGAEAKAQFENGRFQDGRAFLNDPKILQGIADVQRRLDPLTQVVEPGGDPAQTMNDEIAEIEKFMRTDRPAYNKDETMQARLRELYDIRTKHKAA